MYRLVVPPGLLQVNVTVAETVLRAAGLVKVTGPGVGVAVGAGVRLGVGVGVASGWPYSSTRLLPVSAT